MCYIHYLFIIDPRLLILLTCYKKMTLIRFLFGTCLYLLSCQLVFQYFNEHNRSISETGCKDRTFFSNSKLLQIFFSFFNKNLPIIRKKIPNAPGMAACIE